MNFFFFKLITEVINYIISSWYDTYMPANLTKILLPLVILIGIPLLKIVTLFSNLTTKMTNLYLLQVLLFGIPLEIAWTATVSWWADQVMCKVMVFLRSGISQDIGGYQEYFRIFGYFISGNVLMAISLDRYVCIIYLLHRTQNI